MVVVAVVVVLFWWWYSVVVVFVVRDRPTVLETCAPMKQPESYHGTFECRKGCTS